MSAAFDLTPRAGDILPFARWNASPRWFRDPDTGQIFTEGETYLMRNGGLATVMNHANAGVPIFQVKTPKGITTTPAGAMHTEGLRLNVPVNEDALAIAFQRELNELIGVIL